MRFRIIDYPIWITLLYVSFEFRACFRLGSGNDDLHAAEISGLDIRDLRECFFPDVLRLRIASDFLHRNLTLRRRLDTGPIVLPEGNLKPEQRTQYRQVYTDGPDTLIVECQKKSNLAPVLTFDGSLEHDSQRYLLHPFPYPLPDSHDNVSYVTIQQLPTQTISSNHKLSEKSSSVISAPMIDETPTLVRQRRETGDIRDLIPFIVDVLVVVDYSVYKIWLDRAKGQTEKERNNEVVTELQYYYKHVINGVDQRYRNIDFNEFQIRVRLADIVIIDNQDKFPWVEHDTAAQTKDFLVNADDGLTAFREWINKTDGLPEHDHAVLFTRYDLYTQTNMSIRRAAHTSGLAFIGTLCAAGDSVAIVEEQGGFQSIGTTAHELGHSLGALHDGQNNTCRSEDRYIMASSGFGPVPDDKILNPWRFSECSVKYFRDFIASQLANGTTCLLDRLELSTGSSLLPEVTSPTDNNGIPGQYYSADEQCRLIWGSKSYMCRGAEFGNASTVCTAMYCRDPATANDCVLHTAAHGTSCGNQKWCVQGRCTYSKDAPVRKDFCVLGDQPGVAFNGQSCAQLVSVAPSYCYQEKVRARCCQSCGNVYLPIKGCEFGDRIQGCQSWHCGHLFQPPTILTDCCKTCKTGETIAVTQQPSTTAVTVEPDVTTTSGPDDVCRDSASLDGMLCWEYIHAHGNNSCYMSTVAKTCCETCAQLKQPNAGCEYGDRLPSICKDIANMTSLLCVQHSVYCCGSCLVSTTSTSQSIYRTQHGLHVYYISVLIAVFRFVT